MPDFLYPASSSCTPPAFPDARLEHVTFTTPTGLVASCGGKASPPTGPGGAKSLNTCVVLDALTREDASLAYRAIRLAKPGDLVELDPAHPAVPLNCEMRIFDFSGHSTRDAILDYILKVAPKKAFLVHGDDGAVAWFSQEIKRRLPNTEVIVPEPGVEYEI